MSSPLRQSQTSSLILFSATFLCLGILFSGCRSAAENTRHRESQYDRVSREIEELKALSEAAADPGDNIKVVVNLLRASMEDSLVLEGVWRYVDRNVAVSSRPKLLTESGLRIGVGGPGFKARLDVARNTLISSEESELFLVLADGASGYINIGREISVPRFYYFSRWYTAIGYEFRRAGRSFETTVHKLPSGLIDVELTPVFSNFLNDGGDLELTELSTRVTVAPGQILIIGGDQSGGETIATALLGYSRERRQGQTLITLTVHAK